MKKIMIMLAFLMVVSGTASAAQLLTNPGFEAGDLSGWTKSYGDITPTEANIREGNYAARCWWDGNLNQRVPIIPGTAYTLTASAYIPSGGVGSWGSYVGLDWLRADGTKIEGTGWSYAPQNDTRGVWHDYSSGAQIAPVNAYYGAATLGTWQSNATPANPTDFDNFALNGQPIPEPASMLLLGSGLVGLFGVTRKKRS